MSADIGGVAVSEQAMLEAIGLLTGLEELDLSRLSRIKDLKPLAPLTNLRLLSLYGVSCLDWKEQRLSLAPLEAMSGLELLDLDECKIDGVAPLGGLRSLRVLNLPQAVSGLSSLKQLSQLAEGVEVKGGAVKLEGQEVKGIDLALMLVVGSHKLKGMTKANLTDCYWLKDVSFLTDYPKLKTLRMTNCCSLQSLDGLASSAALETLTVSGTDSGPFPSVFAEQWPEWVARRAEDFRHGRAGHTRGGSRWKPDMGLRDVSALQHLSKLKKLVLARNAEIASIASAARLKRLTKLSLLGCTGIEDIESLRPLLGGGCKITWPSKKMALS